MLDIPMCLPNTYKYKISVERHQSLLLNNCYLKATCFDSFESSSGPSWNRSKII